jgi:hypothetical protein
VVRREVGPRRARPTFVSVPRSTTFVAPDTGGRGFTERTHSDAYVVGTRGTVRVRRNIDGCRRVAGVLVTSPTVYEHYRPTDAAYPDGVYRVVGVSDGRVTLLRVANADGRRTNSGELVTADAGDLGGFTPAENPDGNRSLADAAVSAVRMAPWSALAFARQLAANPLPTAVAVAFFAVGAFGAGVVRLPASAWDALVLVGTVALVYVGSGRA